MDILLIRIDTYLYVGLSFVSGSFGHTYYRIQWSYTSIYHHEIEDLFEI